jgi:lactoylglutathione lyase
LLQCLVSCVFFFHDLNMGSITWNSRLQWAESIGKMNFPAGFVAASESSKPLGVEIALVTPSVEQAHAKALAAGATELKEPATKPWGQVVSYVRCPDGTLVEICSPVGGSIAA